MLTKEELAHSPLFQDITYEEYRRMLSTDYMLWTNLDAGAGRQDTSCTVLGGELLRRAGVPSTPYFAYLAQSAKSLLFYTGSLWIGPDGELLPEDALLEDPPGGVRISIPLKSLPMVFFTGMIMCLTSSRSMVSRPSCST